QLYHAMVAPLVRYPIRGVIWYQGESNAWEGYRYRTLFPELIRDWRAKWGNEFPFLWVQLANFMASDSVPVQSEWAELREAQSMTLSLPKTGQAVAIDIGDPNDIHPTNKQDVGHRLALAALKVAYGKDIVYSGPVYKSMEKSGDKIIVSFTNAGGGLTVKDKYGYIRGFAIAGADEKFYWAQAYIDGDKVVVYSPEVKNPVAVRYAWGNNPDANLYNREGLPASPFRTDSWNGISQR
ncbi:MAG TPA: sialate O-acetylesterase, partial [Chryseosolibacter sp.]|nr:sialate O-acetylesterase [Chryseosolibacter sp.]